MEINIQEFLEWLPNYLQIPAYEDNYRCRFCPLAQFIGTKLQKVVSVWYTPSFTNNGINCYYQEVNTLNARRIELPEWTAYFMDNVDLLWRANRENIENIKELLLEVIEKYHLDSQPPPIEN